MLGRTSFTRDEVDNARRGMEEQLAAYRALTAAIAATPDDDGVATALAAFETRFVLVASTVHAELAARFVEAPAT
jgi:hypothetical protein